MICTNTYKPEVSMKFGNHKTGIFVFSGNLNVLYNYVVVLWSVNKKDAAITWCQGRDIETASDSFHLTSLLKQKRNRLR